MTKLDKVAVSILKPINPSIVIILGVYTIVWGLWIIVPFWDVFSVSVAYGAMHSIANEWAWGAIAIFCGAVTARGALKPSYKNLKAGSLFGFFHWFIVGIMFLMGDVLNPLWITSFAFAIYSGLIWVNIKVNKEHYAALHKK